MAEAPFHSPFLSRFRDTTESENQNDYMQQVFYDIASLFDLANKQEDEIEWMHKFFEIASHYSQEHHDVMRKELDALKEDLQAIQRPGESYTKHVFPSDAREDVTAEEFERAVIDTHHDIITVPYSTFSSSKLYLYDEINEEYILPNMIEHSIVPAADGVSIIENDFRHCLTPDEFKLWHREYRMFKGTSDHVEAEIVIQLPEEIISTRDTNTLYIHPFPLNTMDILSVEYQTNGGWSPLPGFLPVQEAGNTKFCFSPIEVSAVRIKLRQRHFIEKGGMQVFHMGIREIGIAHHDYQNGVGRFEMPVAFNPAFTNKQILTVVPRFLNEGTLSAYHDNIKLLTFKVYEVDSEGNEKYISDTFPIQVKTEKIVLKGILSFDRNTRSTPALASVEVVYKGDS